MWLQLVINLLEISHGVKQKLRKNTINFHKVYFLLSLLAVWCAESYFTVEQDLECEKYKIKVVFTLLSLINMYSLASVKQLALEIFSDIQLVSEFYKAIFLIINANTGRKKYNLQLESSVLLFSLVRTLSKLPISNKTVSISVLEFRHIIHSTS